MQNLGHLASFASPGHQKSPSWQSKNTSGLTLFKSLGPVSPPHPLLTNFVRSTNFSLAYRLAFVIMNHTSNSSNQGQTRVDIQQIPSDKTPNKKYQLLPGCLHSDPDQELFVSHCWAPSLTSSSLISSFASTISST